MDIGQADTGNTVTIIISALVIGFIIYQFIRARKSMSKPASENTLILNDGNFKATIATGVTLVDFWAAWCQPCQVQGPIVDEIADEVGDDASVAKLNIDENRKTASMLGIRSIPTIFIFKNGKIVEKFVGVKNKNQLMQGLKKHLS